MQRLATAACLTALTAGLSAQEFTDTFSVPSTSGAPGWTVQTGVWSVSGGRLLTNGASTWSYITKDGYKPLNCVIDIEAFYTPSGVQFAGCTARYAGTSSTLMCKIQENTTATQDFDRSFIYEQGGSGGSMWADLTTKVTGSAIVRFIVCGNQTWMQHDFNKDGTFDQTIGPRTTTTLSSAGLVGANMYGKSQIDNWKCFTAVLKEQANATPKIGTTYNMDLVTTATATAITPWRAALSGGNKGFPIGKRRIPLDADPIFNLSLDATSALGLAGVTDAAGKATVGLKIPNFAPLVGVTLFCSAITIGKGPDGIVDISNEHAITFVK